MDDIAGKLMAIFLDEMEERLVAFERDLLSLEAGPAEAERIEIVHNLLRGAHSLKGAATSVGAEAIAKVAHALEELLVSVRDGEVEATAPHVSLLLQTADVLREAAQSLRDRGPAPDLAPVAARLAGAARGETVGAIAPQPAAHDQTGPFVPTDHTVEQTVRITAERMDGLLQQSGELLVASYHARSRVAELASLREGIRHLHRSPTVEALRALERNLDRLTTTAELDHRNVEQAARRVDAEIRRIRMRPFQTITDRFERIVRDAAHVSGKEVRLLIEGGEIELDRAILQGLRDSLTHLIRNAVDHGIESASRRVQSGKPRIGTVTVAAALRGEGVEIAVADDGGGIDAAALRARAIARGLAVDDLDLTETIFLPGLSSAAHVTGLSGRGVGLDAVRTAIYAMRGTVTVASTAGRGTRFVLNLPLTLTAVRAVLFEVAGRTFALEGSTVSRLLRIRSDAIVPLEGRPVVPSGDQLIPLVPFETVLGLPRRSDSAEREVIAAIVISLGDQQVALGVDALIDEREIIIRSLGPRLAAAPSVSGATMMPDGSIALIVRTAFVLERAFGLIRTVRHHRPQVESVRKKRILLVDDSITTRTLERSILEAAEYDVVTAGDGAEAMNVLASGGVDLIVSDVDMPVMDGFALVEAVRGSATLRALPIVLVTARERDEDRRRGLEVGADAYVAKSTFDQHALLDIIAELL